MKGGCYLQLADGTLVESDEHGKPLEKATPDSTPVPATEASQPNDAPVDAPIEQPKQTGSK